MEGLQRLEGVNISKGQVRVEGMEQSHMAAENIREQWRMLGMNFYITSPQQPAIPQKLEADQLSEPRQL